MEATEEIELPPQIEPAQPISIEAKDFNTRQESPMKIPFVDPHRHEDMPLQFNSRNSIPSRQKFATENSTITDSVNKSIRDDGVVSIADMLSHAH